MGTVDNIFVLHGLISHMINNNKKLYCSFIDFSKAFNYIVYNKEYVYDRILFTNDQTK